MLQNEQCSLPHYLPASLICSLFQSNCLCLDIYLCWTASAQINEHAAHWLGSTYRVKYHLVMWCPNGDLYLWFQHNSRNFQSISCCQNEPHNKPCNVMCIHMISNNSLSPWEETSCIQRQSCSKISTAYLGFHVHKCQTLLIYWSERPAANSPHDSGTERDLAEGEKGSLGWTLSVCHSPPHDILQTPKICHTMSRAGAENTISKYIGTSIISQPFYSKHCKMMYDI